MIQPTPWCNDQKKCPCCETHPMTRVFSSNDRFFNRNIIYDFLGCPSCRCLILFPRNNDWCVNEAYPDNYRPYIATPLCWYHQMLSWYCFPKLPKTTPMPIWDIGAGTGLYLEYLSRKYKNVSGIEMDAAAVRAAQSLGRQLTHGTWESFEPGDGNVGTLVMNHAIEHLLMPPKDVFAKAYRILKPGGLWCIRTPNSNSWGRKYFNEFWLHLDPPRHTVIYSLQAVKHLAERTGFELQSLRYAGKPFDLTQSVHLSLTRRGSRFFATRPTHPILARRPFFCGMVKSPSTWGCYRYFIA